ncbi:metal-sensitive transcriptional regulator [soil metagenome]
MAQKVSEVHPMTTTSDHDPEAMKSILNRLRRAEGQLHALVGAIGPEANCRDVVTQLAAVSKALDRAGFAIIANAMRDCVDGGQHDQMDAKELERLFLSLA